MKEFFTIPEGKEPTHGDIIAEMERVYADKSSKFPAMFPPDESQKKAWMEFVYDSFHAHARAKAGEPLDTVPYDRDLPDYGDLMTVEEWVGCCEEGGFIDYDGSGHPVRAQRVEWKEGMDPSGFPTIQFHMSGMHISPSTRHLLPKDATHVMWFNR
ncbi:hypothetical protein MAL1_00204 [Bacteriophage DSS3_MAL1]|nr:hypothetical protein MAL1_00204 [Bacteriophage DSS3_MAL1]